MQQSAGQQLTSECNQNFSYVSPLTVVGWGRVSPLSKKVLGSNSLAHWSPSVWTLHARHYVSGVTFICFHHDFYLYSKKKKVYYKHNEMDWPFVFSETKHFFFPFFDSEFMQTGFMHDLKNITLQQTETKVHSAGQ